MKVFSFIAKHWKAFLIYPLLICVLFVSTCFLFNFLLVPAKNSSVVESIMDEAKRDKQNIDIVFMGSSRTFRSINSYELSNTLNKNIYDIAYEAASYSTNYFLLQELTKKHKPNTIFLEVSVADFLREKSTEDLNAYKIFTGSTQSEFAKAASIKYNQLYLLDFTNYLENFSNERFIQNLKLKFKKNYNIIDTVLYGEKIEYYGKGFLYSNRVMKEEDHLILPATYGLGQEWEDEKVSQFQLDYLNKIIDYCKSQNIDIYLYSPPYPQSVIKDSKDIFEGFDKYILEKYISKGISYIDLAKIKKEIVNLSNVLFCDANHCNKDGANAILPVITEILNDLDNNTYDSADYFYSTFDEMITAYEG